jgi:hypothetical protein
MTENWSEGEINAWQWVQSANKIGLSATAALREYREAGGKIRTQEWYSSWNRYESGAAQWGRLYQFSQTETVPASLFLQVPTQYRERYTMTFTATVRDTEGRVVRDMKRQVSSDRLMSSAEWQSAAATTVMEDLSQDVDTLEALDDIEFFERMEENE